MTRLWDPHAQNSWTLGSPRANRLAQLWPDQTLSVAQIARIMGVTRNSVVGARWRLHLPPRPSHILRKLMRKPAPERATAPLPPRAVTLPQMGPEAPAPRPGPRITWENATTLCCWPIGDPKSPDFHFCDVPRERIDGPYCEAHHRKAYTGYGGRHG